MAGGPSARPPVLEIAGLNPIARQGVKGLKYDINDLASILLSLFLTFAGFPGCALSIRSLLAMPANVTQPPARVNPVSFSGLPRCRPSVFYAQFTEVWEAD